MKLLIISALSSFILFSCATKEDYSKKRETATNQFHVKSQSYDKN